MRSNRAFLRDGKENKKKEKERERKREIIYGTYDRERKKKIKKQFVYHKNKKIILKRG
jgi:hypothetical protein